MKTRNTKMERGLSARKQTNNTLMNEKFFKIYTHLLATGNRNGVIGPAVAKPGHALAAAVAAHGGCCSRGWPKVGGLRKDHDAVLPIVAEPVLVNGHGHHGDWLFEAVDAAQRGGGIVPAGQPRRQRRHVAAAAAAAASAAFAPRPVVQSFRRNVTVVVVLHDQRAIGQDGPKQGIEQVVKYIGVGAG